MITALCGGVGGSKLVSGLSQIVPDGDLAVVVNTADDLEFCGLHVSPDLDTVTYTLAGLAQQQFGWGIEGDTFGALNMLARYGVPDWFHVGDRDLGTDIFRTWRLQSGESLTAVTAHITAALGVRSIVLPMTDGPVSTQLLVAGEWLEFQEYFVHRRHGDPVDAIRYVGIEQVALTAQAMDALARAEVIVLVNSNPLLSIMPILNVPGARAVIERRQAPSVAVSPLIGQGAISGPAGELMRLAGVPASATGVAELYRGLLDGILIAPQDAPQRAAIEAMGIRVCVTDIVMQGMEGRRRLASETLQFARSLT